MRILHLILSVSGRDLESKMKKHSRAARFTDIESALSAMRDGAPLVALAVRSHQAPQVDGLAVGLGYQILRESTP
jgi:hypothetical protein